MMRRSVVQLLSVQSVSSIVLPSHQAMSSCGCNASPDNVPSLDFTSSSLLVLGKFLSLFASESFAISRPSDPAAMHTLARAYSKNSESRPICPSRHRILRLRMTTMTTIKREEESSTEVDLVAASLPRSL